MSVCDSVQSHILFSDTESFESPCLGILHFPLGPMLVQCHVVKGNWEFLSAWPCCWNQKLLPSLSVPNEFHCVESCSQLLK